MKRKYIIYGSVVMLGIAGFASCKKSYLETTPSGQTLEANYYSTPDEIFTGVVAAYDPLVTETGGLNNTYSGPLGPLNAASDDCVAGGGGPTDMNTWQAWNNYSLTPAVGPQGEYWGRNYRGVSRCNTILSKMAPATFLNENDKKRYTAEVKFLRAYYYFWLVRLFKNIPMILQPLPPQDVYNQPQAAPEAVYKQIEDDLNAAIPDLPVTVAASENGRVTKGAGIALLGKVYLYEKKWTEAAAQLAQVNGSTPGGTTGTYGYKLQSNFGQIFSPDNKFNSESIFELNFTGSQSYSWNNWNQFKSNVYVQMVGPRGYNGPIYWGGWGFSPVTTGLATAMKPDPRYGYTVANIDSLTKATGTRYEPSYQNTGYFIQKYAPLQKYKAPTGTAELNFPNNYIEIRLADTYLMEAEALLQGGGSSARALALLSAVRERVGLAPVAATLQNVYNERRLELATEGHRWFDLVRTGQAPTVLASKGFKAGTHEILPIPLQDMQNTQLKQNPGY
ncbi:RagB/SusD family nutrient uptake outer membrane protein [Mucilaginibacter roseus]|uniref:RagB/SusD family nutrient uptake outer membrane protein n=1 Tax=Mucilaginibacter roseus TaxID=1528868 RepID=A0ABS8TZF9_9SPHI|nr:RagB/SusD family nutrient uptake outer membrane protein [Mucilaginibacter roseus]MCD8739203.1 RagB/SusD family nutrient uptake outer membrane protein [Mucilaginibacter roseus]